jgi:hypothetical protein
MIIKDDAFYPINEIAEFVGWSKRKLQRYASKSKLRKIDGRYLFTGLDVKKIKDISDNVATTSTKDSKKNVQLDLEIESIKAEDLQHKEALNQVTELKEKIAKLEQQNSELKNQFKEEIPHQEKLKKAIELITIEAMQENLQHKIFTDLEYNDLIGTISSVEYKTEQIEYLRGRVDKQDEMLLKLSKQVSEQIASIRERNYIEAKEKGFDKK